MPVPVRQVIPGMVTCVSQPPGQLTVVTAAKPVLIQPAAVVIIHIGIMAAVLVEAPLPILVVAALLPVTLAKA